MSDLIEVTKADAENYCAILTALGMEEEGDPVAEVRRLTAENAALRADGERLDWIAEHLFTHHWNGVIDSGSRREWHIVPEYRHITLRMVSKNPGFRAAIDAARAKESGDG